MRQRTGKKRPRERTRGRRRDGDDDSASSASEGEDWRQEVWRRGYQGAMPWAAAWQMWPQGVAAMQYAGQQMHGEAGNFRAHQRQSEPPWTQQSQGRRGDNGWGSRKRQRRTFPEQRGRWEEEEEEEEEEAPMASTRGTAKPPGHLQPLCAAFRGAGTAPSHWPRQKPRTSTPQHQARRQPPAPPSPEGL
mmetsp:Transcript_20038/g.54605  ORF Transcript_20038/g.54605 Transcript_20038/m.54605 type:complete len:190 (-) Transcript_20038:1178-1747(-)